MVTRGTTIASERSIGMLVLEMGLGVLNEGTLSQLLGAAGERGRTVSGTVLDLPAVRTIGGTDVTRIDEYYRLKWQREHEEQKAEDGTESVGPVGTQTGERTKSTTRLWVDGVEQPGRTSALAAWRLALLHRPPWTSGAGAGPDPETLERWFPAGGSIERTTTLSVRGHVVNIHDTVRNGMVCAES